VRSAAARALARTPKRTAEDARALEACGLRDRSGAVARTCRQAPVSVPKATNPVLVYVVTDVTLGARPGSGYAVELADGVVHVGTTDRRGAFFDPAAPDGTLVLLGRTYSK
jgi:hypothetical protein